jgi:hypothetical protein
MPHGRATTGAKDRSAPVRSSTADTTVPTTPNHIHQRRNRSDARLHIRRAEGGGLASASWRSPHRRFRPTAKRAAVTGQVTRPRVILNRILAGLPINTGNTKARKAESRVAR